MSQLVAQNLNKSYPTPTEPLVVLKDLSLELAGGESLAVVGPSGCGKSTLLHVLGTLDTPSAGSVALDGVDPFSLDERGLARFRNDHIGFVFQDHHLLPQLTVLENVLLPVLAREKVLAQHEQAACELITRVGLEERVDHRPAELSGGERQRAAVARALVRKPSLVLADEPTGNLDTENAQHIVDLLTEMHTGHASPILIVVTHSADVAARMARRVQLKKGQLEESR